MIGEIGALINEIEESHKARYDTEIMALQAQINPHFIYNTLSSIRMMAMIQSDTSIVRMLDAFISLMQYSANFTEPTLTMRDEACFLEQYIYIQQMRYNAQILFTIDFAEDTLDLPILRFVIQPLLENSIFHGMFDNVAQGQITVRALRDADCLRIQVIDNGEGMDNETLRKVTASGITGRGMSRIGVRNVNERIKILYGDQYGLSVESSKGLGCTVTILFPLLQDHETTPKQTTE